MPDSGDAVGFEEAERFVAAYMTRYWRQHPSLLMPDSGFQFTWKHYIDWLEKQYAAYARRIHAIGVIKMTALDYLAY